MLTSSFFWSGYEALPWDALFNNPCMAEVQARSTYGFDVLVSFVIVIQFLGCRSAAESEVIREDRHVSLAALGHV
jgi:hypothetical protein